MNPYINPYLIQYQQPAGGELEYLYNIANANPDYPEFAGQYMDAYRQQMFPQQASAYEEAIKAEVYRQVAARLGQFEQQLYGGGGQNNQQNPFEHIQQGGGIEIPEQYRQGSMLGVSRSPSISGLPQNTNMLNPKSPNTLNSEYQPTAIGNQTPKGYPSAFAGLLG